MSKYISDTIHILALHLTQVMAELRPLVAGRADLSALGTAIRDQLSGKKAS
jgi:hypothetical protein